MAYNLKDFQVPEVPPGSLNPIQRGFPQGGFPQGYSPSAPGAGGADLFWLRDFFRGHPVFSKRMPWIEPDIDSVPIDVVASLSLNASSATYQTVASYTPGTSSYSVIVAYGHELQGANESTFNSVNWQFTVNGSIVPNYGSFTIQRGTILQPKSTFIFVKTLGGVIKFNAQNNNTAAYTATCGFWGWEFGRNLEVMNDYIGSLKEFLNY